MPLPYPADAGGRGRFVTGLRAPAVPADPWKAPAVLVEDERTERGEVVPVGTVFLTGAACPWRCVFCDLWKGATAGRTPRGAPVAQLDAALPRLGGARRVKLYNGGSFFDPAAVPPDDLPALAGLCAPFERVIVECHPALAGEAAVRFRERLAGDLEVAMGLETAHPGVLRMLNKRMTADSFRRAADYLRTRGIAVRAFVLVGPPFLPPAEAVSWAVFSAAFAFDCGATAVSLIPVRPGNGALDELARQGLFSPPPLAMLEEAAQEAVALGRGRAFADTWDLALFSRCEACLPARWERLEAMNRTQAVTPPVRCDACGEGG